MSVSNNPAGRIKDILTHLRNANQRGPILHAWAAAFECDAGDTRALMVGLLNLGQLNDLAREVTLRYVDDCPGFYLEPFASVEALCNHWHMETPLVSVPGNPSEATMTALAFVDHHLARHFATNAPGTSDQIAALIATLDTLLEDCLRAEMDTELKLLLIRQVQSIRAALVNFRVSGPEGLEAALEQAYGSMMRNRDTVKAGQASGDTRLERFFDILGKTSDLQSGFQLIQPALAPAAMLLLSVFN